MVFRMITWTEAPNPLENDDVLELSKKYGKTPAQILLRHLMQRNIAVIPKSVNEKRIKENFEVPLSYLIKIRIIGVQL